MRTNKENELDRFSKYIAGLTEMRLTQQEIIDSSDQLTKKSLLETRTRTSTITRTTNNSTNKNETTNRMNSSMVIPVSMQYLITQISERPCDQ